MPKVYLLGTVRTSEPRRLGSDVVFERMPRKQQRQGISRNSPVATVVRYPRRDRPGAETKQILRHGECLLRRPGSATARSKPADPTGSGAESEGSQKGGRWKVTEDHATAIHEMKAAVKKVVHGHPQRTWVSATCLPHFGDIGQRYHEPIELATLFNVLLNYVRHRLDDTFVPTRRNRLAGWNHEKVAIVPFTVGHSQQ